MKAIKISCPILCFLMSWTAYGNNALRGVCIKSGQNDRKELIVNKEFVKQGRKVGFDSQDVQAVIPLDLAPTSNGEQVFNRIMSKTGKSISKSEMVTESFAMRTVKQMERTAKRMALSFKAESAPTPPPIILQDRQPSATPAPAPAPAPAATALLKTKHKFKVDMQPLKGMARVTYSGFVDSKVEYRATEDRLQVEISEQLSKNSRIALTHHKDRAFEQQYLMYQLNW